VMILRVGVSIFTSERWGNDILSLSLSRSIYTTLSIIAFNRIMVNHNCLKASHNTIYGSKVCTCIIRLMDRQKSLGNTNIFIMIYCLYLCPAAFTPVNQQRVGSIVIVCRLDSQLYLSNQNISPLTLWVRIPLMVIKFVIDLR
jgi:hypothetical protein